MIFVIAELTFDTASGWTGYSPLQEVSPTMCHAIRINLLIAQALSGRFPPGARRGVYHQPEAQEPPTQLFTLTPGIVCLLGTEITGGANRRAGIRHFSRPTEWLREDKESTGTGGEEVHHRALFYLRTRDNVAYFL